ncbi:exopolysaccharide biosynthesis protein [Thioclava pacifica]|uniref:Exopolysaccharide biosynthesis protein n=1 Tax=Thioclava pacifica DSM 10166 TaxID=1353537 RepID=A0A074K103_9RHOB|nr:exopolysaccharide biosynthesis protein [Thioclava pacifica]KEO55267.1 hypothetical protein TP2_15860 [Thioclava pacifica DSM 10166]
MAERISVFLRHFAGETGTGTVTIGALIDRLGDRAHGLAILLLALPCTLPMPYGIPTAFGAAILLVSAQLLLCPRAGLWLPRALRHHPMGAAQLGRVMDRALPLVERLEHLSHPRQQWAAGAAGRTITAILCAICGLTMLLPIPLIGNIPPAIAATALAVGLLQRDGLVLIAGLILFVLAMALIALAWWGIVNHLT